MKENTRVLACQIDADLRLKMKEHGVRIDIWTHFMRGCIIDYVH